METPNPPPRQAPSPGIHRVTIDTERDPTGARILAMYGDPPNQGAHVAELARLRLAEPDDLLLGWVVAQAFGRQHRLQDQHAALLALHERRPDLQFGADVARLLRAHGRAGDADRLVALWAERHPHVESALAALLEIQLRKRQIAEAKRLIDRVVLL